MASPLSFASPFRCHSSSKKQRNTLMKKILGLQAPMELTSLNVYRMRLSQPFLIAILRQSSSMAHKGYNGHTLFAIQRQSSLIAYVDTTWLSAPSSSRDGKSDDVWRPIMVICHLCQPEASEPVDQHAETTYGRPHPSYPKTTKVPFII